MVIGTFFQGRISILPCLIIVIFFKGRLASKFKLPVNGQILILGRRRLNEG